MDVKNTFHRTILPEDVSVRGFLTIHCEYVIFPLAQRVLTKYHSIHYTLHFECTKSTRTRTQTQHNKLIQTKSFCLKLVP